MSENADWIFEVIVGAKSANYNSIKAECIAFYARA